MVFKTKNIKPNLTIGQRLYNARTQSDLTLEQAEVDILIRSKYLRALENDNWRALPGRVYFQGYLRRYADYLGLDGQAIIKQFSQEFSQWTTTKTIDHKTHKKFKPNFAITPKLIAATAIGLVVITMASYIGFQIHKVTAPPTLVIVAPSNELSWDKPELEIIGRTSLGAVVLINNQNVTQDDEGNFHQNVALQEGLNSIEIIAKSRFDKQTSKIIKILKTTTSS